MKIQKSQYQSAIITAIISALILLLLFILGISAERNAMDEGVMISFGTVDDGFGNPPVQAVPQVSQPAANSQELITQDEPSVVIDKTDKKKTKTETKVPQQEIDAKHAEEQRQREEQAAREASSKLAGNAFRKIGDGQGTGTGDGQQGNPAGRGSDGGNSWSLAGRSLKGRLAQPSYRGNEQGRIVVQIRVDQSGTVVDASITTGTTITSEEMRQAALKAARKNVFSTGNSPAIGTITYNFALN